MIPVSVLSTPNVDGDVIHEVQAGQTLWQIAIAYDLKINDIKSLNNLFDNNICPGNKLLIRWGVVLPTASPTEIPTSELSSASTSAPTSTASPINATSTPTQITISAQRFNNSKIMNVLIGIIVLALLGGGIFTRLGNPKKP